MKKRNGKLEFKIHITFLLAADETIIFTETRWKHHSIFRFRCVTLVIASLVHPYGAPETLPLQQEVKSLVDVLEANFMGYELVKLQLLDRGKSTGLLLQQNARSRCMHVGLFWIDAPPRRGIARHRSRLQAPENAAWSLAVPESETKEANRDKNSNYARHV